MQDNRNPEAINIKPRHSWRESVLVYSQSRVLMMLFLGFSAGLPLFLIFSSLSLWLREAGVDRSTVTYFSWAALAYSFKFIWSPLIDKLPLPVLTQLMGRRRGWLLTTQLMVAIAIIIMALSDPSNGLQMMVIGVVMLGFSSASQDIVIDALRIESAGKEYQAAMSAMYIMGYRIGMIASGAGALYLAAGFGSTPENYSYQAWQWTYFCMAGLMSVGIVTTLLINEPERNAAFDSHIHSNRDYAQFVGIFVLFTLTFVLAFNFLNPSPALQSLLTPMLGEVLSLLTGQLFRIVISLGSAIIIVMLVSRSGWVNREMIYQTYIDPVVDFFRRYGKHAVTILLLVGLYRTSDIVLGVIANVFYQDMGFSKEEIATYTKVFGVIMTIVGGLVGGVITTRFGVMPILLLGAIMVVLTNLLFMVLANIGYNITWLAIVIAADNVSAGVASAAFIAYLSSLTNISFTAIQYAIFSSLMTLMPKTLGGYSGSMVDQLGYSNFFLVASLLGVPAILLVIYLMKRMNVDKPSSQEGQNQEGQGV